MEPLSPELALVDPDLAARARAALPVAPAVAARPTSRSVAPALPAPVVPPSAPADETRRHPYPLWARVTAAMWFVVVGILIGGAAIPHAQDTPRLIPKSDVPSICKRQNAPAPLGPAVTQPGP
jgi:hypothetical protein